MVHSILKKSNSKTPLDLLQDQRGITMMAGLLTIMISSLVAFAVATALGNAADGMSQYKSYRMADDLESVVAGLLSDSTYCAAHFKKKKVSSSTPAQVATNIALREITETGTLGSQFIIQPGDKYQNFLNIKNIEMETVSRVSSTRYMAMVRLTVQGTRTAMTREIPMHVTVNTAQEVVSCGRYVDPAQGLADGMWSEKCDDFMTKGWPDKQSCLRDGRWHVVYSTQGTGVVTYGHMDDVVAAVNDGAEVRVSVPVSATPGATSGYEMCASAAAWLPPTNGSKDQVCMTWARPSVVSWSSKTISEPVGLVYFSDGLTITNASARKYQDLKWHVRF